MVVDLEPAVRSSVVHALEQEGLRATEAASVGDALGPVGPAGARIVILGFDGLEAADLDALARVRSRLPDAHVIVLSGAAREQDRVRGLRGGADDYVAKPFSLPELVARVASAVRHRPAAPTAAVEEGGGPAVVARFGDAQLDLAARTLLMQGRPVSLTRREFDLLAYFVRHAGRTFTREQLLAAVWASSADWQSETTVTEHVRRLRGKLEADPSHPRFIVTVQGVGYRFSAD